jgi:hypothetical protein
MRALTTAAARDSSAAFELDGSSGDDQSHRGDDGTLGTNGSSGGTGAAAGGAGGLGGRYFPSPKSAPSPGIRSSSLNLNNQLSPGGDGAGSKQHVHRTRAATGSLRPNHRHHLMDDDGEFLDDDDDDDDNAASHRGRAKLLQTIGSHPNPNPMPVPYYRYGNGSAGGSKRVSPLKRRFSLDEEPFNHNNNIAANDDDDDDEEAAALLMAAAASAGQRLSNDGSRDSSQHTSTTERCASDQDNNNNNNNIDEKSVKRSKSGSGYLLDGAGGSIQWLERSVVGSTGGSNSYDTELVKGMFALLAAMFPSAESMAELSEDKRSLLAHFEGTMMKMSAAGAEAASKAAAAAAAIASPAKGDNIVRTTTITEVAAAAALDPPLPCPAAKDPTATADVQVTNPSTSKEDFPLMKGAPASAPDTSTIITKTEPVTSPKAMVDYHQEQHHKEGGSGNTSEPTTDEDVHIADVPTTMPGIVVVEKERGRKGEEEQQQLLQQHILLHHVLPSRCIHPHDMNNAIGVAVTSGDGDVDDDHHPKATTVIAAAAAAAAAAAEAQQQQDADANEANEVKPMVVGVDINKLVASQHQAHQAMHIGQLMMTMSAVFPELAAGIAELAKMMRVAGTPKPSPPATVAVAFAAPASTTATPTVPTATLPPSAVVLPIAPLSGTAPAISPAFINHQPSLSEVLAAKLSGVALRSSPFVSGGSGELSLDPHHHQHRGGGGGDGTTANGNPLSCLALAASMDVDQ